MDAVNENRSFVVDITSKINELTTKLEAFSWFENVTESDKILIDFALMLTDDLCKNLSKNYATLNRVCKSKNVLKDELKAYKQSISDLKEVAFDIRTIYFTLPNDKEFQELNKELASL